LKRTMERWSGGSTGTYGFWINTMYKKAEEIQQYDKLKIKNCHCCPVATNVEIKRHYVVITFMGPTTIYLGTNIWATATQITYPKGFTVEVAE